MARSLPVLVPLLDALRAAHALHGHANDTLERATARIAEEPEYRSALAADVHHMLAETTSTHLFTEVGILSDEPLASGVLRRLGRAVAPAPERVAGLEGLLAQLIQPGDARVLRAMDPERVEAFLGALLESDQDWNDASELASALVILATRVAGVGLDPRLTERRPDLEAWTSPFLELSRRLDRFAEAYVGGHHLELAGSTREAIDRCHQQVVRFRAEKEQLGTTLHLSSASLRMLQQLRRLDLLVACTLPDERRRAVPRLAVRLGFELARGDRTATFVRGKIDLLAYLVVGHAVQKGDKYAARSRRDYVGFVRKSLFGGLLVAVFALAKLHLTSEALAPVPQGLVYGLNYAVCFALIYVFGATLATKQPALTASRIADALDGQPGKESFSELVRAICRSQLISFAGNVIGAAAIATAAVVAWDTSFDTPFLDAKKASSLADAMHPIDSWTVWYAAIAGVLLSATGFLSAFVDNFVVFHRLGDRVASRSGVFGWLPERMGRFLAKRIEKHAGGVFGNVALGFMLGSAGTVGVMLGVPFDIRHIAFSSSHGAVALWAAPELRTVEGVLPIVSAIAVIGLVNFLVSFCLTLVVAFDARRLEGGDWRTGLRDVWTSLRADPLAFVWPPSDAR